ncbi:alpha/beta fold hydrolase [Rhodococcus zopfii]|uniref:alpha/beta fold hydrolase n=1 Tax=Rhodococcus zopfii TaxID=43772 RepID=UPI00093527D4|nr:alpha/beta hydrolase [Rhodococcus zopfii]
MHDADPTASPSGHRPLTAVVLPGTGSDAQFADAAFRAPLERRGIRVVAVEPDPRRVVGSYLDALDREARAGAILAGGVSIGAAVALHWAARHPSAAVGVLAALPAWTGSPEDAPAAASARWTAHELRTRGLEPVVAAMVESSPMWLGRELSRSWRAQWPDLPAALEEAATFHALDADALGSVTVPVGITAAIDDAVHPLAVAQQWADLLPRAAMTTVTLDEIGADPTILGTGCLTVWDRVTA